MDGGSALEKRLRCFEMQIRVGAEFKIPGLQQITRFFGILVKFYAPKTFNSKLTLKILCEIETKGNTVKQANF